MRVTSQQEWKPKVMHCTVASVTMDLSETRLLCGVEQKCHTDNGFLLLEGSVRESVTECVEKSEDWCAIK